MSEAERPPATDDPAWLAPWRRAVARAPAAAPSPWHPGTRADEPGVRHAAVLILIGPGPSVAGSTDPWAGDVLLTVRAAELRSHAGQVSFPGGGREDGDADDVATAMREAEEEVGLDPRGVDVLGTLPSLWLPPSSRQVTPVVGAWREPHPLSRLDEREVAAVAQAPVAELAHPARRVGVVHPGGGTGPGFLVADLFVWGFTAGLLAWLLDLAELSRPWDPTARVDWQGTPLPGRSAERADAASAGRPLGTGAGTP